MIGFKTGFEMEDILDFDTSNYLRINRDGDIRHLNFHYFRSVVGIWWMRETCESWPVGMDGHG